MKKLLMKHFAHKLYKVFISIKLCVIICCFTIPLGFAAPQIGYMFVLVGVPQGSTVEQITNKLESAARIVLVNRGITFTAPADDLDNSGVLFCLTQPQPNRGLITIYTTREALLNYRLRPQRTTTQGFIIRVRLTEEYYPLAPTLRHIAGTSNYPQYSHLATDLLQLPNQDRGAVFMTGFNRPVPPETATRITPEQIQDAEFVVNGVPQGNIAMTNPRYVPLETHATLNFYNSRDPLLFAPPTLDEICTAASIMAGMVAICAVACGIAMHFSGKNVLNNSLGNNYGTCENPMELTHEQFHNIVRRPNILPIMNLLLLN